MLSQAVLQPPQLPSPGDLLSEDEIRNAFSTAAKHSSLEHQDMGGGATHFGLDELNMGFTRPNSTRSPRTKSPRAKSPRDIMREMRELGVLPKSPREQAAKSPRNDRRAQSPRALRPKSPRELRPKSPRSEAAVPRAKSPRGASNSVLSGHLGGSASSQARMDLMAKEMEDMKKNLSLERRQRQDAESRINQVPRHTLQLSS